MVTYLLVSLIVLIVLVIFFLINLTINNSKQDLSNIDTRLNLIELGQGKREKDIKDDLFKIKEEFNNNAKLSREEIAGSFRLFSDFIKNQLDVFTNQLANLKQINEKQLTDIRQTVDKNFKQTQENNDKKLELIRATVDEKLSSTLEKRLGESFKLVSERLELVHKGLGEMQTLATGVGDLKKVLTNIKTRGTWGEIQLGSLLEQILTEEQYAKNVITKKGSNERVEFAIKLPGRDSNNSREVWLPIDSKFPKEDYERLVDAREIANVALAEESVKQLEIRIKAEAKDIKEKYISPPHTTDFGLMFLPFESLYAEVLRRPGLCDLLQRDYRVVITGPSTLAALLNSLQMGFRTLAIEKRTSEVWILLSAVKTEFNKFGNILDKTQKKLQEASNTIEQAAKKSRTIEKKLNKVQDLPIEETTSLIEEIK